MNAERIPTFDANSQLPDVSKTFHPERAAAESCDLESKDDVVQCSVVAKPSRPNSHRSLLIYYYNVPDNHRRYQMQTEVGKDKAYQ
ncbi:uncharacterized protein IAS62_003095 [Cryptococcus decagattii]|uniref:Uncharacterized protein n=1 Tax=Cryptococcus decagattii TaxID=1859122 RepID=A0ABZ2AWH0_9TREE